jgi:hypothetical protein
VPDDLLLLKEIGSSADPAPVDVEQRLRQQLLDRIVDEASGLRPVKGWRRLQFVGRRSRMRVWFAVVVAALAAAAALVVTGHGGEPSIADKAYAAIARSGGIMHFVAEYPSREYFKIHPRPHGPANIVRGVGDVYEEYWIDLAHPRRKRIVQSAAGHVLRQQVYVDHVVPYGGTGWDQNPLTSIIQSPKDMGIYYPGSDIRAGKDPIVAYRELLRTGNVLSESETTYRGRDAYELVIQYKPPYDLVDDVWTGDRQIYVVDRQTYFPLESTFRLDPTFGGYVTVTRYPMFEILPESSQTRALLEPVKYPQPYRP